MSIYGDKKYVKAAVLLVDILLIILAYVAAFHLRYSEIQQRNWESFLSLVPWIALLALFFLSIYELYRLQRKSIWDIIRSLFVSLTLLTFLTMAASFFLREFALPRSVILIAYVLQIAFLTLWKAILVRLGRMKDAARLLLIAQEDEATKLISHVKYSVKKTKVSAIHPNTEIERIMELINRHDGIMMSSDIDPEKKTQILYHAVKTNKLVYVVPSLYDLLLAKSDITSLDDTMVMAVKPFGLSLEERLVKRAFDILLSILALLLLSPVIVLIAVAIKLEDPGGSILYKQKRIGLNNKAFTILKFRSMVENAEKQTGPVLAIRHDPRITRVGRFLRPLRLDEIPQLINVLKGDMSIVGPRPEREHFTKILNKQYSLYQYRSTVKPGITGYAQIMGKYTTDVKDKLIFDLYYIRNYSLILDFIIMLRTFSVLLDHKKSEGEKRTFSEKENSFGL